MLLRRKHRSEQSGGIRFAIDPGAFRTRFYSATEGLLLDQPAVGALDRDHPVGGASAITSYGDNAVEILEADPDRFKRVCPVQSDQHNELGFSPAMLRYFLDKAKRAGLIGRAPEISLVLPHDSDEKMQHQLKLACHTTGAISVTTQDAALATFYGSGLEQTEPCVMIDFGATGSRLIAIVDGQIASYQHLAIGGDDIDATISDGLLQQFGLQISDESAREIKHSIAAATPQSFVQCTRNSCQVNCLSVNTGTTSRFRISSETVSDILQPVLYKLSTSVRHAFAAIDNEIKDAAYETGIRLCGGGALLSRMDQLVMSATDLPVERINRPFSCTVRGAASQLTETQPAVELEELF